MGNVTTKFEILYTIRPFQVEKLMWGLRMEVIAAQLPQSQLGRTSVSDIEEEAKW